MQFKPAETQFILREKISNNCNAFNNAAFVVVPVPYEKTTSYGKGTKHGPQAVIAASRQLELWDEETRTETWKKGVFTLAPVNCALSEKKFFPALEKIVDQLLASTSALPFFIGGEHSITQGLLPPFQRRHKNLSILHFDAHADLRPSYEGSEHSHACAVYPVSRDNKLVQIGIRSVGSEERRYHNSGLVQTHLMHENMNFKKLERNILRELTDTVYLTIDVDGFDPSVMPGTGTPQPGGFGWHEAMKLFKAVCLKKKVVGVDVVEVSPIKGSPITEFNAAKLIYRLMGYLSATR